MIVVIVVTVVKEVTVVTVVIVVKEKNLFHKNTSKKIKILDFLYIYFFTKKIYQRNQNSNLYET